MKKNRILSLLLAGLLALALTACGGTAPASQPSAGGDLTTMGDALAVEAEYHHATWDDEHYIYVFDNNGTPTRVVAEITPELSQQIDDALFHDGGGDEAVRELLSSLELVSVEDLSTGIPDQAAMDELVGKTGQELLDDGYEVWGTSFDGESVSFTLAKGLYSYEMTFEGDLSKIDEDNVEASLPDLTVTGVTYAGISDNCTDLALKP